MNQKHITGWGGLFALLFGAYAHSAAGALTVADIFSDHLVLQRDQPVPVWGWADAGQAVRVSLGDVVLETVTDAAGRWQVLLPAQAARAEPQVLSVEGDRRLVFSDVVVGEVWLASGQSNMGWTMGSSAKTLPAAQAILHGAEYPGIRYRAVHTKEQFLPQDNIGDGQGWSVCTPALAKNYSAVAFLFALRLHLELQVPIGIIESAWGGHPIEPYIPQSAFVGHPVLEQEWALSEARDLDGLRKLVGGVYARNESWLGSTIFNARVAPVAPYGVRGLIWYQAESNCGVGEDPRFYAEKMKALVRGWRAAWAAPELPVYFVQLPQFASPGWVPMRDEQRRALSESHTGMAVLIDLALDQIHPANKIDVAERLARWPLAKEYGKNLVPSGPLYRDMGVEAAQVIVRFDYAEDGLTLGRKRDLEPTELLPGSVVHGFELAGRDGVWWPADARIDGNRVVCRSQAIEHPLAVRYAWAEVMPQEQRWNLYNHAGLPASPFISHPEMAPFQPQPVTP